MSNLEEYLKAFPCHPLNKDGKYYKGKINICDGDKNCNKCEYMHSYGEFICKHYNNYALEVCCDVDKKFFGDYTDNNPKRPEALLVNRKNENEKIAIEAKTIYQALGNNIKMDNRKRALQNNFLYKLDSLPEKINQQLEKKLKEDGIGLKPGGAEEFNKGLLLQIKCKKRGDKQLIELFQEVVKKEKEFLEEIASCSAEFMRGNIKKVIEKKPLDDYLEFYDDNFLFRIGKSYKSERFATEWFDNGIIASVFEPNKKLIQAKLEKYFRDCEEKFLQYDEYKRILLLINDNR
ncbi:hypothetical protein [Clostridium sp. 3-3]|uniref:hypothetical protein n=1 Tax=Clostridium sp. 3-3 TaxID=2070757 RepID=UPI000CDB0017|nr:hypothetical protein [Clostridium sp. 3-3]POO87533.1 hypothetical protein C1H59_05255 [Clostridium sp. 3-3]